MADTAQCSSVKSKFKRICVFCGSSSGNNPKYQHVAIKLGKQLAKRNINLVYGGGSIGLMGLVSKAVRDGGRNVLRIIPKALAPKEITEETVREVIVVLDMHQRKAEMFHEVDAFIALLGGYETWKELMEVTTWAQLGIHNRLVGLLNIDGYYDSLLSFLRNAIVEEFITPAAMYILVSAHTTQELMCKLEAVETTLETEHQHHQYVQKRNFLR